MSRRIEHTDPLTVLRELPARWAQTCITTPPERDTARTLTVLAEVQRVLRKDGTLWLLQTPSTPLLTALLEQGWLCQPLPGWARPLSGDPLQRPVLLAKSPRYFHRPRLTSTILTRQRMWCGGVGRGERCGCCPARRGELVERCILGCSAMLACGACGAPHAPTRAGGRHPWTPHRGCSHLDLRGRCLVLDPFYDLRTGTAELASHHGRAFLGITGHTTAGERW